MPRKNNVAADTTTATETVKTATATPATAKKRTTRKAAELPATAPEPAKVEKTTIDFSPMGKVNGWVSARQRHVKEVEDMRFYGLLITAMAFLTGIALGVQIMRLDAILH